MKKEKKQEEKGENPLDPEKRGSIKVEALEGKKTGGFIGLAKNFLETLRGMGQKGLTEKMVSGKKKIGRFGTAVYGYRIRIGLMGPNKKLLKSKKEVTRWSP